MENIVVYYLFVHNISLLLFVAELLSCTFVKQKEVIVINLLLMRGKLIRQDLTQRVIFTWYKFYDK